MRFIDSLIDSVFPPRPTELIARSINEHALCARINPVCTGGKLSITSLLPYGDPGVQACIIEAKFHANRHAAQLLGKVLYSFLLQHFEEEHAFTQGCLPIIVPLPLSKEREKARGYNQSARIVEAAVAANHLQSCIHTEILMRIRPTLPQTTLTAQARQENVRGAFLAQTPIDPRATYIVVDDVRTTGATLRAALTALLEAGATRVEGISLAHQD